MKVEEKIVEIQEMVPVTKQVKQFTITLSEEEAKVLKGLVGAVRYDSRQSGLITRKLYSMLGEYIPFENDDVDKYFTGFLTAQDYK